MIAMSATVRFSVGGLAISREATTPLTLKRVVSMSGAGAAPVARTASVGAPTCSASSTVGWPPMTPASTGPAVGPALVAQRSTMRFCGRP